MRRTLATTLEAAQASPTYPTLTMLAWLAVAGAGLVIVGGLSKYLARRRQREENARWLEEAVPYATADAEATAKLYDPLARRQARQDARENVKWLAERYAEEKARANGVPVLEQGTAKHPLARVRQAEAYKELP